MHTLIPRLFVASWLWLQFLLPATVWASDAVTAGDERVIDRSGFGAAGHAAWSALTDYEISVMQLFEELESSGRRPAYRDLLDLYLLASGDIRHEQDAQLLRLRIDAFFSEHDELHAIADARERGARLLQAMHRYFLRADEQFPLAAYDEDQSQLSELLRSGIYNCISSALLYLVLAEHAGLTTSGVIMPSHAFVQVILPDGRTADVETTTAEGFDVVRDKAFFEQNADEWFRSRRLVVPSFADYEQRSVVSAAGLGYESMWSQHTTEARMPYADRLRLAEFRGILQADQPDAQHNRLVYYYREAQFLRGANDMAALDQLMSRAEPLLSSFENIVAPDLFTDAVSTVPLLLLQAERADWMLRTGSETDAAVTLAFDVLRQATDAPMNVAVIRDLAYRALHTQMMTLIGQAAFADARAIIQRFAQDCSASAFCVDALEQYYVAHGRQYWQQSDWHRTIAHYEEYLARGLDTDNREIFTSNLETAYLNQAAQYWFDEERDEAESILEVCVIRAPDAQRCQQRLQEMGQRR